jgi:hypothetical protein
MRRNSDCALALVLGRTTIVEQVTDETHFAMDFRIVHPLLGQVLRYSAEFEARASESTLEASQSNSEIEYGSSVPLCGSPTKG